MKTELRTKLWNGAIASGALALVASACTAIVGVGDITYATGDDAGDKSEDARATDGARMSDSANTADSAPTHDGADTTDGARSGGPDASTPPLEASSSQLDAPSKPADASQSDDAMTTTMDAPPSKDAKPPPPDATPPNLVTNGDFSMGTSYWAIVYGNGTLTVNNGMGCVTVIMNHDDATLDDATLGWPEAPEPVHTAVSLDGAHQYTLSFTAVAMTGGPVTIDTKVGQVVSPYTADFETEEGSGDVVTNTSKTFTHVFSPMYSDPAAGIAFAIPQMGNVMGNTTVCFSNVSLVQN